MTEPAPTDKATIELVVELENRWGVRLPDQQAARLASMTVGELTAVFAALLDGPPSSSAGQLPTRQDILLLLAEVRGVQPEEVDDAIDSLGRMWLLHSMEQRYHVPMDIPGDVLARMDSVDDVVRVLTEVLQPAGKTQE